MPSRPQLSVEEIMAILPGTVPQLTEVATRLTRAQLRAEPEPGEWSISENLAHMRACQVVLGGFMLRILSEDKPAWRALSPRTYMGRTDFVEWEFDAALDAFAESRNELLEVLSRTDSAAWQRTATVKVPPNKVFDYTVQYYGDWLAGHERTHLRHILKLAERFPAEGS